MSEPLHISSEVREILILGQYPEGEAPQMSLFMTEFVKKKKNVFFIPGQTWNTQSQVFLGEEDLLTLQGSFNCLCPLYKEYSRLQQGHELRHGPQQCPGGKDLTG